MGTLRCLRAISVVAMLTCPRASHADLQDDVARLVRSAKQMRPYHLGPRILEQTEELPLLVPGRLARVNEKNCLHLVVLAAQSVQFTLNVPGSDEATDDMSLPSRAGLVEYVQCGQAQASLVDATVMMLSPRGVLDVIGFIDDQSVATTALRVLPWRAVGNEAPEHSLNHWAASPNLTSRLEHLERRASFQGANRTERRFIPGEDLQSGEVLVGFDPGCHEIQLITQVDEEHQELPFQTPELVWADNGQPAARDWSNGASPTFRVCTSVARIAKISFDACPADTQAVLFRSHYPWPAGIPSNWATPAREQMALALLRRHLPSLPTLPAKSWIGSSSGTSLLVPVTPRSCYLAIVATSQGPNNDISLAISSESHWIADSSIDAVGASVAFCVSRATNIKLDVDARGTDTVWILGLWAIASGPLHADFT